MRSLVILLIALVPCWLPLAVIVDLSTGVEGYEMREINPPETWPGLAEANAPAKPIDWLRDVYGTPAAGDQLARFVLVPDERVVRTDHGALIRFDRARGEWLMEAKSLRNLALLATAATAAAAILAGGVLIVLRRRARNQRRSAEAGRAADSAQSQM